LTLDSVAVPTCSTTRADPRGSETNLVAISDPAAAPLVSHAAAVRPIREPKRFPENP